MYPESNCTMICNYSILNHENIKWVMLITHPIIVSQERIDDFLNWCLRRRNWQRSQPNLVRHLADRMLCNHNLELRQSALFNTWFSFKRLKQWFLVYLKNFLYELTLSAVWQLLENFVKLMYGFYDKFYLELLLAENRIARFLNAIILAVDYAIVCFISFWCMWEANLPSACTL